MISLKNFSYAISHKRLVFTDVDGHQHVILPTHRHHDAIYDGLRELLNTSHDDRLAMSLWKSITELAKSNSADVLYDETNATVMVNGAPYSTPLRITISFAILAKLPFEPYLNFIKRSFAADKDVIAAISYAIAVGLFTVSSDGSLTAYSHSAPGDGRVFFGTYDHCSSDSRPYVMVEIDPMNIVAYEPEAPKGVCSEYRVIAEFNTTPDFSSLSWDDDSGMTDAIAQAVHLYSPVQPGPLYDLSKVEQLVRTEQPVADSSDEFEDSSSEYLDDE